MFITEPRSASAPCGAATHGDHRGSARARACWQSDVSETIKCLRLINSDLYHVSHKYETKEKSDVHEPVGCDGSVHGVPPHAHAALIQTQRLTFPFRFVFLSPPQLSLYFPRCIFFFISVDSLALHQGETRLCSAV